MKPEFAAYRISPHARVLCVECHVTPGATGWIESKMAGTRQLSMSSSTSTLGRSNPRWRPTGSSRHRKLARSAIGRTHFAGARLRVIPEYANDEANTPSQTVLMMMVGGGGVRGIHGSHFGPGVTIRYASTDSTRQAIPWVEYRNSSTKEVRTYTAADAKPGDNKSLVYYTMQCVDCHNRPTHTFLLPERAVNRAMSLGRIPVSLPFIRKKVSKCCGPNIQAVMRQASGSRPRSGTTTAGATRDLSVPNRGCRTRRERLARYIQ